MSRQRHSGNTMMGHSDAAPYESLVSRYKVTVATIVGSGHTRFDYADLSWLERPVFFINEAVRLESHARDRHFITHHPKRYRQRFDQIQSTIWTCRGVTHLQAVHLSYIMECRGVHFVGCRCAPDLPHSRHDPRTDDQPFDRSPQLVEYLWRWTRLFDFEPVDLERN